MKIAQIKFWTNRSTYTMHAFPPHISHKHYMKSIIKFNPKENKSPVNPLNYRPISLLEVPGKIFEIIIQGRLNHFLADKKDDKGQTAWI